MARELQSWLLDRMKPLASLIGDTLIGELKWHSSNQTCHRDLIKISSSALSNELWALKILDASGRLKPGIMSGSLFNLQGHFDQCLHYQPEDGRIAATKYCVTYLSARANIIQPLASHLSQPETIPMEGYRQVKLGVCVPESCQADQLKQIAEALLSRSIVREGLHCDLVECFPNRVGNQSWSSSVSTLALIGLVLFSLLAKVCLFTSNNLQSNKLSRPRINFKAIDALKVLATLWIISMHSYSFAKQWLLFDNSKQVDEMLSSIYMQWMANGTFSVDTFFVIGGFLATIKSPWFYQHKLTQKSHSSALALNNKQPNKTLVDGMKLLVATCCKRYLRLAPTMMIVIMIALALFPMFEYGPSWRHSTMMFDAWCQSNWHLNLLMVHNIVNTPNMCLSHSWYLAVDLQLFIATQTILFIVSRVTRNRHQLVKVARCALITVLVLLQIAIGAFVANRSLISVPLLPAASFQLILDYFRLLYIKPYYWFASYAIGCILAIRLHGTSRQRRVNPDGQWNFLLYIALITNTCLVVSIWPYFKSTSNPMPVWVSTVNATFSRPIWSVCLAYLTYRTLTTKETRLTSPIALALSRPIWHTLSKHTFSAYLIHPLVMACIYGSRTESFDFSHGLLIYFTLGNIFITYTMAVIFDHLGREILRLCRNLTGSTNLC